MQELRLVGVDEGGGHLLLSGEGGASFRLPVNEALRMASSRPSTRPAARQEPSADTERPGGAAKRPSLAPRDIQARIRSGATAQDIVDETGVELQHVLRYEGPVRAERDYMAHLAQRVEVASPLPSNDGYRSAFGESPAQLEDMVRFRLRAFGVDPDTAQWDAWRKPDGLWAVVVRFELPTGSAASVGEEPPAQWTFNPSRRAVLNANRWAQVLSELEPLDGPLPSRKLSAVADRVFDFETDAAVDSPEEDDSDELLEVLRSRRGQRLGADEDGDDALALMLAKGHIPAAHPRQGADEAEGTDDSGSADPTPFPGLSLAPSIFEGKDSEDHTYDDGTPRLFEGVSTDTREVSVIARPQRFARDTDEAAVPRSESRGSDRRSEGSPERVPESEPDDAPAKATDQNADRKLKPRRSSVPSWDEIVFGTKGD
ncbi:septation protein SepH [Arthrobacter sp. EH-1B-1]|uniref:Septation protein SepH n=1 Tax=Arthrobacter vasquezii TaxID=2977629 RepID=A0ABT6CYI0_9MICC|nr:septation protein SepH [Arthrobacter vasquezii]MDF9279156.1 septation protein SepH [Arthrobacter vasquezii]